METERSQGKVYHTRLTISQRMSDEYYFGELYVDRDFTNGPQRGSTCKYVSRHWLDQLNQPLSDFNRFYKTSYPLYLMSS